MRIRCFYEQQCGSNAHIIRRMLENCRGDIRPCGSFLLIGKVLKKFVNRCPNLGCSGVSQILCKHRRAAKNRAKVICWGGGLSATPSFNMGRELRACQGQRLEGRWPRQEKFAKRVPVMKLLSSNKQRCHNGFLT